MKEPDRRILQRHTKTDRARRVMAMQGEIVHALRAFKLVAPLAQDGPWAHAEWLRMSRPVSAKTGQLELMFGEEIDR